MLRAEKTRKHVHLSKEDMVRSSRNDESEDSFRACFVGMDECEEKRPEIIGDKDSNDAGRKRQVIVDDQVIETSVMSRGK